MGVYKANGAVECSTKETFGIPNTFALSTAHDEQEVSVRRNAAPTEGRLFRYSCLTFDGILELRFVIDLRADD